MCVATLWEWRRQEQLAQQCKVTLIAPPFPCSFLYCRMATHLENLE